MTFLEQVARLVLFFVSTVIIFILVGVTLGGGMASIAIIGGVMGLTAYLLFFKKKKKPANAQTTAYQNTCSCGNALTAAAQFCSACGKNTKKDEPARPKICPCGNTPEANVKFCNACGRLA
jgi:membrane protease subunit (stomatin/prohibitin family)